MENNPRKSKALIIAIIFIIFLLIVGFLVYKNRDRFGEKTSGTISKIFSPLVPSVNSKNLKSIDENSEKTIAQAGEDIKAGDNLSLSGTDANNNPIVVKAGRNSNIYGFAGQDILNGELGEVIINGVNSNSFWNSFSDYLNNLFGNEPNVPSGGWSFDNNLGIWVFDPNGFGGWVFDPNGGGWIPPGGIGGYNPQCSDTKDNDGDGQIDINDPNCHVGGTLDGEYLPNHYSESSNPLGGGGFDFTPQCSDTNDNDGDEQIDANDPNCHVGGTLEGVYLPNHYSESSNPLGGGGFDFTPQCSDTNDNDGDEQIDANDPNCHVGGTLEGVYLPNHYSESTDPLGGGGVYTPECSDEVDNDADGLIDISDPTCHEGGNIENEYLPNHVSEADEPCENGASNPPLCTIFEKEKIPDLTAGGISPTSVLSGVQTTISTPISNIGEGSTISSFTNFFHITNQNMGETEVGGDDISKSKFNKFFSKIFKKETWVSRVKAATTGNTNVIINVELQVNTSELNAGESRIVTVVYGFNTPGMYYVRACADKSSISNRGEIEETNEDNNCGPWTAVNSTSSLPPPGELPVCSDGNDNDRDRMIDNLDPGCHINGDLDEQYIPSHNNESVAPGMTYECSDGLDNDGDDLIDDDDPACHMGGNLENEYVAEHDSELVPPVSGDENTEENICLFVEQNPLEFTAEEKARLALLLRKFYLISSSLRTVDDIATIYNEIDQQKSFMSEIESLTKQCYLQTNNKADYLDFCARNKNLCNTNALAEFNNEANTSYQGVRHQIVRGNPWFTKSTNGTFSYASGQGAESAYFDVNWLEGNYHYDENGNYVSDRSTDQSNTGPGCKVISGYYYGKTTKSVGPDMENGFPPIQAGVDCSAMNNLFNEKYGSCSDMAGNLYGNDTGPTSHPYPTFIQAGCQWKPGFDWEGTERMLNIW